MSRPATHLGRRLLQARLLPRPPRHPGQLRINLHLNGAGSLQATGEEAEGRAAWCRLRVGVHGLPPLSCRLPADRQDATVRPSRQQGAQRVHH